MFPSSRVAAYDRAITMFSPDGHLYQVEYASKIIEKVALGTGMVYNEGVLLTCDKDISSKLIKASSVEKLFKVDDHIGAVSAGIVGDARRIISFAREKAQENKAVYGEPIQVEALAKEVSIIKQAYTQFGGARPFGVSFIFGGCYGSSARIFETEPSGALTEYYAVAIGRNRPEAMKLLEKRYSQDINFDDALRLSIDVLKLGLEQKQKIDLSKIGVAFITVKDKLFSRLSSSELEAIIK